MARDFSAEPVYQDKFDRMREFFAELARVTGRSTQDRPNELVLSRFKMAAVPAPSYARFVQGKSSNPMHEYFGNIVLDQAAAPELAGSLG